MDNFAVRDKGRAVMVLGGGILFALVVLAILTATAPVRRADGVAPQPITGVRCP